MVVVLRVGHAQGGMRMEVKSSLAAGDNLAIDAPAAHPYGPPPFRKRGRRRSNEDAAAACARFRRCAARGPGWARREVPGVVAQT